MRRALTALLGLVGIALGLTGGVSATSATRGLGAGVVRTVYFSALDSKGAPIADLTAADLSVKEGGKDQRVPPVRPPRDPRQVHFIVDDGGPAVFQGSVPQLLQTTLGHGQFAISVLQPQ